jgi:hypothetical protein
VKIRKGLSCKLINNTHDVVGVHAVFHEFAKSIANKARHIKASGFEDPTYDSTVQICKKICDLTQFEMQKTKKMRTVDLSLALVAGVGWYFDKSFVASGAAFGLIGRKVFNSLFGSFSSLRLSNSLLVQNHNCDDGKKHD